MTDYPHGILEEFEYKGYTIKKLWWGSEDNFWWEVFEEGDFSLLTEYKTKEEAMLDTDKYGWKEYIDS